MEGEGPSRRSSLLGLPRIPPLSGLGGRRSQPGMVITILQSSARIYNQVFIVP